MWAPMYKQVTLVGILGGTTDPKAAATAYASAKAAFDDYIKHDNHGRGFVLIGHSQGSFVLKQLIADEIDKKPALRKRMVSALLLGGNVTDKAYKHVRPCSKAGQTGCVVAWSMFHDPPPADSLFGRTTAQRSARRLHEPEQARQLVEAAALRADAPVPRHDRRGAVDLRAQPADERVDALVLRAEPPHRHVRHDRRRRQLPEGRRLGAAQRRCRRRGGACTSAT